MSSFDDIAHQDRPALRIGYVLKRFPRLTETFILNEMLELERQGVEVEIFSLLRPKDEPRHADLARLRARVTYLPSGKAMEVQEATSLEHAGSRVNRPLTDLIEIGRPPLEELMPRRSAADVANVAFKATALALLARSRRLTHLHAHFGSDATTVALLAGRIAGLTFSYTAHAKDIYHTYVSPAVDDAVRRRKLCEAAFVVTVSDFNKRHLERVAGGPDAARVVRVYNGIDVARFRPDSSAAKSPGLILCVGRLVEKKGLPDLVAACQVLRARGLDFRCEIVGEGPLRGALSEQITTAGLDGCVALRGALPQSEVLGLMHRAQAFVLPCIVSESGDRDGLPTVLLEALAAGLPSVSTTVSGVPEIIDNERSGLLVEPGDRAALAAALDRILTDRELAARCAEAGRARALSYFDLSANVSRLRVLFEVVSSSRNSQSDGESHAHRLSVG